MRHRKKIHKLGRTADHRAAMLANLAMSLIAHERIKTTKARAKALQPFAERLVTLAKKDTLHARRLVRARLRANPHWEKKKAGKRIDHVKKLFADIAPANKDRQGGYTRILKLPRRHSDAAEMAYIEWVDRPAAVQEVEVVADDAKKAATEETAESKEAATAKA
jgi:large subunit ribosomal protein L17